MIEYLRSLEEQVCQWPGVSAANHRFGGRLFRLGRSEVGHVHNDGAVEIAFPRSFRDELIGEGMAQEHRTGPDGWVTFHIRQERDVQHALWLLRISYLRLALKAVPDPPKRLEQESERLSLSPRIKDLLARSIFGKRSSVAA